MRSSRPVAIVCASVAVALFVVDATAFSEGRGPAGLGVATTVGAFALLLAAIAAEVIRWRRQ